MLLSKHKNVTLFFIFHNAYLSKTILLLETTTILYLKTKKKAQQNQTPSRQSQMLSTLA
jgi:hypothetical protein